MMYLWCRLLTGTLALAAFLTFSAHNSMGRAAAPRDAVLACKTVGTTLGASPTQAELYCYAFDVVKQLTPGKPATWEGKDWETKVELGLEDTSKREKSSGRQGALKNNPMMRLYVALSEPVQAIAAGGNHFDDVTDPRLATVFYNPAAVVHIKANRVALSKRERFTPFPAGSIIVKAIWQRGDLGSSSCTDLPASTFFSTTFAGTRPRVAGQLSEQPQERSVGVPNSLKLPFTQIPVDPTWKPISITDSGSARSYPCKSMYPAAPLEPASSVYSYILPNDPLVLANPDSTNVKGARCNGRCLLSLLGVNLMVKAREGYEWIWITLWWTGVNHQYEGMNPESPWQYYEIGVSNRDRDTTGPANILFNPFLEGTQPNGTVANCKTCHQYAAVDPKNRSHALLDCGTGVTLGGPPLPAEPTANRACGAFSQPSAYLGHYLTTDSLWSLASAPTAP